MKFIDIIDMAYDLHLQNGGESIAPKMREEIAQSLAMELLDHGAGYLAVVAGAVPSDFTVQVPGFRSAYQMFVGGNPAGLLPVQHKLFARTDVDDLVSEEYQESVGAGVVIRDGVATFVGYEEGDQYEIVYYADHIQLPLNASPKLREKNHVDLVTLLAYKFRIMYQGKALNPQELQERKRAETSIRRELNYGTSETGRVIRSHPIMRNGGD